MFASLNLHALKVMTECTHNIMTSFAGFLFTISIFVQHCLTGSEKKSHTYVLQKKTQKKDTEKAQIHAFLIVWENDTAEVTRNSRFCNRCHGNIRRQDVQILKNSMSGSKLSSLLPKNYTSGATCFMCKPAEAYEHPWPYVSAILRFQCYKTDNKRIMCKCFCLNQCSYCHFYSSVFNLQKHVQPS